ncbi:DUF1934 domain-containing protein [Paucisalibacillus globulus]|uniref:DUF1934 domain-containing protein n=1 Tax=Paucisalibacillus globulus TaxID=351095 RepID=UPI000423BA33|nr:DUF1934 domain-containing protein [Paucisalibacillus globulus]
MDKQVRIHLHTVIEDNGLTETNTSKQLGKYYRKDKMDVITFEEKTEEGYTIKSLITIQPEKVNIKRLGVVSMNQQFLKAKITENVYTHPHGNIHMETFTKSIDYQAFEDQNEGFLKIDYTVKLNGQDKRNHMIMLKIMKEDKK